MKHINIYDLRHSLGNTLSNLPTNELTVVLKRNRPICILTSITDEEFHCIKLQEDISHGLDQIEKGSYVSHMEMTERFLDEKIEPVGVWWIPVYAQRILDDFTHIPDSNCERILKKIYEKCHFRQSFNEYMQIGDLEYIELRIGRYAVVCMKNFTKNTQLIQILCIYPPHGSCKERFRWAVSEEN